MHLLADDTTASNGTSEGDSGRAPKADMESIRNRRPACRVADAMALIGLSMPELVSQWTATTWVIAGSRSRASVMSVPQSGWPSPFSRTVEARPRQAITFAIRRA